MAQVNVVCIEGRRVGDDEYATGEKYKMDAARAEKYSDYFRVTSKVATKRKKSVTTKNAGATEDK